MERVWGEGGLANGYVLVLRLVGCCRESLHAHVEANVATHFLWVTKIVSTQQGKITNLQVRSDDGGWGIA